MNEEIKENTRTLAPFAKLCMTIGQLPSSYVESMSYYEQLIWFTKYLQEQVIPAVNQNAGAVTELQQYYLELQDYVNHYFDNLDVQEEINNKLDEMAQDGTLTDIVNTVISVYINPLIEEQNQAIQNQNALISTIDAKVEALENINPIPVTSVDDMTDTTKIYVNISNGYWYYYDGDSWEQGGLYQSSQNVDDIAGLLTAYKSSNIKGLMNWKVASINSSGVETSSNYFLITSDMQQFNQDIYLDYSTYTKSIVFLYNNDDTFNKQITNYQNQNKGYFIPANQKFKIQLDYVTAPEGGRPNISADDPKETNLYINFNILKYDDYKAIQYNKLYEDGIMFDAYNLKNYTKFILGDYGTTTGLNQGPTNYRRILPYNILKYDKKIKISSNNSNVTTAYIWFYDDINGTNPVGQGWKDIYNTEVLINANQCFRCVVSKSPTFNEPLYNIYDNDVFKALEITYYNEEEEETALINPNIKYINSVAHQGYSISGSQNYCKLEGYQNAKDHGFNYGELDLRTTSDGVLVCCHDDRFTSGGETITISTSTYNEIKDLDYYGGTIATFEQILNLSKKIGLGLYIDHLYTLSETGWQTMFDLIKKYRMQDNVVYLCNELQAQVTKIMNFYYKSKILFVTSSTTLTTIINLINTNKTQFNKFGIDVSYNNFSTSAIQSLTNDLPSDVAIEVWTIDNFDTFESYIPYVDGITSNAYSIIDVQ